MAKPEARRGLSPVVACTLTGDELAEQSRRWRALGARAGLERADTDDGIQIRFRGDPGVEQQLRALVAVERECCRWARWEVETGDDSLRLHVTSTGIGVRTLHGMFLDSDTLASGCGCDSCSEK
jgi:hypothetical protein